MNVLISDAEFPRRAHVSESISLCVRLLNLTAVILPLLGFVAVVVWLWGRGLPRPRSVKRMDYKLQYLGKFACDPTLA